MSSAFISYCFENKWDYTNSLSDIYSVRLTERQEQDLRTAIRNGARRSDCLCIGWDQGKLYNIDSHNATTVLNVIRNIGPLNIESMLLFLKNKIPGIDQEMVLNYVSELYKQGFISRTA
jgi:hypothetical protein